MKRVLDAVGGFLQWFRGAKVGLLAFRFKSLSELLTRLPNMVPHSVADLVRKFLPPEMGTVTGWASEKHEAWIKTQTESLRQMHRRLEKFVLARRDGDERELRRKKTMTYLEQRRESVQDGKKDFMARLANLGVSVSEEDLYSEGDDDLAEFASSQAGIQIKNDLQSYENYEQLWHAVLGLQSVEIFCGGSRMTVSCNGLDFMDLLPQPPSILAVEEDCRRHLMAVKAELDAANA